MQHPAPPRHLPALDLARLFAQRERFLSRFIWQLLLSPPKARSRQPGSLARPPAPR